MYSNSVLCLVAGRDVFVSDIAIFVLKRDVKLQLTNWERRLNALIDAWTATSYLINYCRQCWNTGQTEDHALSYINAVRIAFVNVEPPAVHCWCV